MSNEQWAMSNGQWAMVVVGALLPGGSALAQARASEPAKVSQTIAGAEITIEYSRPSLRGRHPDSLFGTQIEWGAIWTPGANNATTLSTSRTIVLNGTAVAAGKYGVWIEVRRDSSWLVHLHPDTARWHLPPPPRGQMIVSIPATPRQADGVRQTLAWEFDNLRAGGGQMRMWWGRTLLPIEIAIESSLGTAVAADVARRYEGAWTETSVRDTTRRRPFTIRYDTASRQLVATGAAGELPQHGTATWGYILLPRSEDIFVVAYTLNGELAQVPEPGQQVYLEFTVENGRATSYVRRNARDQVTANAVRTP